MSARLHRAADKLFKAEAARHLIAGGVKDRSIRRLLMDNTWTFRHQLAALHGEENRLRRARQHALLPTILELRRRGIKDHRICKFFGIDPQRLARIVGLPAAPRRAHAQVPSSPVTSAEACP